MDAVRFLMESRATIGLYGAPALLGLQLSIGGKRSTLPFPVRILRCVKYVANHTADLPRVGIICSAPNTLLIKTSVLAPFLGVRRNGLNKIFRDYGFELVRAGDVMAEVRDALPEKSPHNTGWTKRVFRGETFNATMAEEEASLIAQEVRANRRIMNRQLTRPVPTSLWMVQDMSPSEMDEELLNDFDILEDP
jgi:hypothetical protein